MLTHFSSLPRPPKRTVILGASGVIGRACVERLKAAGTDLVAPSSRELDLCATDAPERLAELLLPEDAIVMLAGLSPDRGRDLATFTRNLQIMANLCAALDRRDASHVVYVSSDSVYPRSIEAISEESCAGAADYYSTMHLAREIMLSQIARCPLAVLRLTQVCAPGDPHLAYGPNRFLRQALEQGKIVLFGDGEETRDHIMVEDVARIIERCLAHRSAGLVNVASEESLSFRKVAEMVAALSDPPARIVCEPRRVPITHRRFDTRALQAAFPGFVCEPLAEGIRRVYRVEMARRRAEALVPTFAESRYIGY